MSELEQAFETPSNTQAMTQVDPETGEMVEVVDMSAAPVTVDQSSFDFDALEQAEVGVSLQPIYWSPSKAGQISRGFFQGMSTITKNEPSGQKEITVAMWINREGLFMNGGAGFVKLFSDVQPGTPIQLEYKGQEKTAAGHKVNTFKLNLLNL